MDANNPKWWYEILGKKNGPIEEAGIQKLIEDGILKNDDLVWKEGMDAWMPRSNFFFAQSRNVVPPPLSKINEPNITNKAFVVTDTIYSPMAGKCYLSPKAGAEPYIVEGDFIAPGDVLCVIEKDNVRYEVIEKDFKGDIDKILVSDCEFVENEQPLFSIIRNRWAEGIKQQKATPSPFPSQRKKGNNIPLTSTTKAILNKKFSVGYTILILLIGALCIYGVNHFFSVPKEFKPLCQQYKIYFDPLQKCYIFKFRGRAGGYNIYKNGDKYYCEMEVALNSREMIYHGSSYPTVERAMEAVELGLVDNPKINYDDNLDVEYMGEFNGNGLIGQYERGSTKKRCDVICD